MAKKQAPEELKKRIRELEEEVAKCKGIEKTLDAERKRLFALLDELPGYVYLQARDHSIRFANRLFRRRFGDPEGRACYEVITGRDKPLAKALVS